MEGICITIIIDNRERSKLRELLEKSDLPTRVQYMDAGDIWIDGKKGNVLIEVSTIADFQGKIMSKRLWKQVEKCMRRKVDQVIFILVGTNTSEYSKINVKAVYGAQCSIAEKGVRVMQVSSMVEAFKLIEVISKRLDLEKSQFVHIERQKPKQMTSIESALSMLTGLNGVGSKRAGVMLERENLYDLVDRVKCGNHPMADTLDKIFSATIQNKSL